DYYCQVWHDTSDHYTF
nr:immunoglobulin light chain junction region [Macaca mulatta]MOX81759.1 immunoglobulin light chain junction region [Macaca mulatta]MOX82326.1 immunoglobulin light chain junction region [Macaca mulatta]MOX82466.1 immunoglobulin light chain junction region [Macaca mulatta]MOX82557.1 immunoglobulin light chain junction region [Macaca mulatta]